IIADEPTSNSDKNSSEHLMRLLAKVQEHNKTVIVITHDLSAVKRLDKRVITLADGAVISDIPGGDNDE
ncbi:MAG: cell division ATP-binding protein FtsE, partial [Clostridia bacterium]|nr:cell division ATP-binding protein FtsE [Clostridia bacterium]